MMSISCAHINNIGVQDLGDFEAWARENAPDQASNAIRDLIEGHSVGAIQTLGRRYVSQASNRLATLVLSKGAETRVESGTVYVRRSSLGLPPTPRRGDFGGSDWAPLAQMVREGHIAINR
jgi:hypothetical protein